MKAKKLVLGGLAVGVGLPVLLLLVVAAVIQLRDRSSGSIVSSSVEREFLLHVPVGYDSASPAPLVISLHAGAAWPAHQRNLTRLDRLADEEGFIVVYPAGSRLPGVPFPGPKMWHTFGVEPGLDRDVRFIADLIDTLAARYAIDPARVYAEGMSNGGGMALLLSCALPDRIAAAGLVAAAESLPTAWCADAPPVPLMAFHGDADAIVPYGGGPMGDPLNPVKPVFPPVRERVARQAARNGCAPDPIEVRVAVDALRLEYRDCADAAAVVLYTLEGAGHSWPGGRPPPKWRVGATNSSVDASRLLWEFFEAHPLSESAGPRSRSARPRPRGTTVRR